MYHEVTEGSRRRRRRVALAVVALAATLAAGGAGISLAAQEARAQACESVREAVLAAAAQCCAVEGSYPSTIEYLEEHYGLAVNKDDFAITYEAFASNVAPSVVVVPR